MCLTVGALLAEARSIDPSGFKAWVEERMPFGYDKASRLVAIHVAYSELPADVLERLPLPWQAMFALRHWAGGRLEQAVAVGEVGPDTTVSGALALARKWSSDSHKPDDVLSSRYGRGDLLAGKLMTTDPGDMNPDVARALTRWLSRRSPDQT